MKQKITILSAFFLSLALCGLIGCDQSETNEPDPHPQHTEHTHAWSDWGTVVSATCTESGTQERTCSCGETETQTVDALGHTEGEWIVDLEPTKTEDGARHRDCTICRETLAEEILHATGSPGLAYSAFAETCTIIGIGSCTDTDVYIPSYIDGYRVVRIEANAFVDCASLTSVTIANGVTGVDSYAFRNCASLKRVSLPATLEHFVGFEQVPSLERIEVDEENPNFCSIDGIVYDKAVSTVVCCPPRKDRVTIPTTVTTISGGAFSDCTLLTEIAIPENVNTIGNSAFAGCNALEGVYITDISKWCEITFGDGTDSLTAGDVWATPLQYAGKLYLNNELVTDLVLPSDVKTVKQCAFLGCTSLKSIQLPAGLTAIHGSAFSNCTSVEEISMPDTVTTIGKQAFSGCDALKSVHISNGVTSIGENAFSGCKSLLYVNIPDTLSEVSEGMFKECSSLVTLRLPQSITCIKQNAFRGCQSLTTLTIPSSVTAIEEYAFHECYRLYYLVNKSNLPLTIGSDEYGELTKYATILENKNGERAYTDKGTFRLTEDGFLYGYVQGGTGKWQLYAYIGEEDTIVLPEVFEDDDLYIDHYELYDFETTATRVIIPHGFTTIHFQAFRGCSALTSIIIPNTVRWISQFAFSECIRLKSVTIPDSVESIDGVAFQGCTSLMEIVMTNSVKEIGESAFQDCTALTAVYYNGSVEDWEKVSANVAELTEATCYYYKEYKPTEEGNYWHYDKDGNIVVW